MTTTTGQSSSFPSKPSEFPRPDSPGDLTPYLRVLLSGETLSTEQTTAAFESIMTGLVHDGEIGGLLSMLAMRTPTSDEILGAARVMRAHVDRLETSIAVSQLVDTAGTGGAPKTFNVSTAAAIIAAAAGAKLAKHGNRSRTGRGSAEVLAQLGVNIDADRKTQAICLEEVGICFCFAIHHHPAAKYVMPVRMALGFPTIFNLLGPLTNPAGALRQLMGVYEPRFLKPIAQALAELGTLRAMVIHSNDGLDEISISAPTQAILVCDGKLTEQTIDPAELGLTISPRETVIAKDLDHAAAMVFDVITSKDKGPARDMTLLSTAATLLVADKVSTLADGLILAAQTIDSGKAATTLKKLVEISNK